MSLSFYGQDIKSSSLTVYVLYDPIFNSIWRLARWKCLETGEMTNPLEYGKCLETGETKNPLKGHYFKGFGHFSCFWTLTVLKVSRNSKTKKVP